MDPRGSVSWLENAPRDILGPRLSIDVRALAAFRVSIGLVLLADLLLRSRNLVVFYTDAGVLPRAALVAQFGSLPSLSLHAVSGSTSVQAALFVIAGAFAVLLALGYRTRIATVASLLLLLSLQLRNPLVLNGGDYLLAHLLFWSVFLPLGACWSIDAHRTDAKRGDVTSVAGAALLVQPVIVYTANGLFKLRGETWVRGEALVYVFGRETELVVLLGGVLAGRPDLLQLLGWVWLGLLLSSGSLLLLTGRRRAVLASLFVLGHLGMALTMRLGMFPLVSIVGLLPFFPPRFWDAVSHRGRASVRRWVDPLRSLAVVGQTLPDGVSVTLPSWPRDAIASIAPLLLAVLLLGMGLWNVASLGYVAVPEPVTSIADPAEYGWSLFAPDPRRTDGWIVAPARLESGGEVDALHRSGVQWDRPPDRPYPTNRWLVYSLNIQTEGYAELRPAFAEYLCARWSSHHEDPIEAVTIYAIERTVLLDGHDTPRQVELIHHTCRR